MRGLKVVTDIDFKKCGHVFNEDAVLYEQARPGYPEEMIDALLAFSGVGPPASVLDIGTGTGKALAPFYSRGFCVTGIDPGDNLLTIARANYPKGEFELTKLEDWEPRERHFDLVVSGQAFHWVPVEVSLTVSRQRFSGPEERWHCFGIICRPSDTFIRSFVSSSRCMNSTSPSISHAMIR
jgi:SAM-dependent methyltransferase